ncbi:hypothetical protein [Streptomyces sp. NBC_01190]|uniref:hypothetical protein n=1 Tax=Streptomyces sp. NBC_01190 TaxID=2903767 RepID=UPI00386A20D0|nr:hypothetical protein OG519_10315 [Streptomyces sp. NBC_01190]
MAVQADHRGFLDYHAGPPSGDATRHLCAAAHLDRRFRTRAIEELIENKHRVPAATPGVDMARVLAECLLARREAVVAGTLVLVVAIGGLLAASASTGVAIAFVLVTRLIVWVVKLVFAAGRTRGRTAATGRGRNTRSLVVMAVALFALWFVGGILVVPFFLLRGLGGSSGDGGFFSSGSGSGYDGSAVGGSGGGGPHWWAVLLIILLWVAIGAVARYRRHGDLAALHTGRSAEGHFPHFKTVFDGLRNRWAEAETLYSDFEPFVGAGLAIEDKAWSFPIELTPDAKHRDAGAEPQQLFLPAVHRALGQGLAELAGGSLYPGDPLRRLIVRDRVFRTGTRKEDPSRWYGALSVPTPGTGVMAIQPSIADLLDYGSHERVRHYLEARAELWEGQIVAAVFLRAYIQGGLLQVEGVPFLLPPIAERYRVVDGVLPPERVPDGAAAVGRSLRAFAFDAVTSVIEPALALRSVIRAGRRAHWYQRMIVAGRPVDHGPRLSLRELGSEPVYQQLFQEVDVHRFFVSVRQRASSAVLGELRRAGYATSEFERMAQTVNSQVNLFGANATVGIGGIQNVVAEGGVQHMTGQQSTGADSRLEQSGL